MLHGRAGSPLASTHLFNEAMEGSSGVGRQLLVAFKAQHPRKEPHLDHSIL